MDLQLKDKVVIVTGGAKGIGEAIVRLLAKEGATPVIVGRNEADNQRLADDIIAQGGNVFQLAAELTHPSASEEAIKIVLEKYGRIDGLVNNAGVNDGVGLESGNYESFVESLHKNVIHYYLMAHHALPALKKSKGAIVNIGSKVADTGQGGTSAYAASNGGRNALTREWAVELLPYGIHCIRPGSILFLTLKRNWLL
jgi:L-fucose dehydrogenase